MKIFNLIFVFLIVSCFVYSQQDDKEAKYNEFAGIWEYAANDTVFRIVLKTSKDDISITTDCLLGGYYLEVNKNIIYDYMQIPSRRNMNNTKQIPIYIREFLNKPNELTMTFRDQREKHNNGMGIDEKVKLLSSDYLLWKLPPYNPLFDVYIPVTYSVPTNVILKRIK